MCVDWDWCHFCKKSKCFQEKNGNIYYCGHWDMHYGDSMFSVSYLIISLIFWDRFLTGINTISSRTDPCQFTLSNKPALGLDSQWTWATSDENSQYFSVAPAALYMMVFTKKKYKPVGKQRFVCNTHYWENSKDVFLEIEIFLTRWYGSKAYFSQNVMLWWSTEKYKPQEMSFDQQM